MEFSSCEGEGVAEEENYKLATEIISFSKDLMKLAM